MVDVVVAVVLVVELVVLVVEVVVTGKDVVVVVEVVVLVDVEVLVDVVGSEVGVTTPPKLAVTVLAASIVTAQVAALPVHAPPQVTLSAGMALSVTTVPGV